MAMSSVVILSRKGRLGQGHDGGTWLVKTCGTSIRGDDITSLEMKQRLKYKGGRPYKISKNSKVVQLVGVGRLESCAGVF